MGGRKHDVGKRNIPANNVSLDIRNLELYT